MAIKKNTFDITKCARPNILALTPYTTARDDYPQNAGYALLDANENAFGACVPTGEAQQSYGSKVSIQSSLEPSKLQLNVYPDSHQLQLKQKFCDYRNTRKDDVNANPLRPENLCFGVGSDECFDGIIRAFCRPGTDKVLVCPPSYNMYTVSANINDVGVVRIDLDVENEFALRTDAIKEALANDPLIKVVFICTPGNPIGSQIPRADIVQILEHSSWNGIVVVDEAYIEFAPPNTSMVEEVNDWPNLIVTHTMSKAFGMDGIRLGISYSQPQIARLLNIVRGPYNMTAPTATLAAASLEPESLTRMMDNVASMHKQRKRLLQGLARLPGFGGPVGGDYVNYALVRFLDKPADQGGLPDNTVAQAIRHYLAEQSKVLVRYRGTETGCVGCLRISVGNPEQIDRVIEGVGKALEQIYEQR